MGTKAKRAREKLGRFIHEQRKRQGINQADLAAAAEMTQPEISKLESGRRSLSPFQLSRIAGRLGLPVEALIAVGDDRVRRAPRSTGEQASKNHV